MAKVEFPFSVESFESKGRPTPTVIVKPGNFVFHAGYADVKERFYNLKLRPDDVLIVSYPKTGSHWISEMLWSVMYVDDVDKVSGVSSKDRVPFLDHDIVDAHEKKEARRKQENGEPLTTKEEHVLSINSLDRFDAAPSPRFAFTHVPFSLLPPNLLDTCKVIYITRNPADATTSFFHFVNNMSSDKSMQMEGFFKMTMEDSGPYNPYWSHVNEAWERKHHKNMAFFIYEEMKKDLPGNIRKMADFLGKSLTDSEVEKLTDRLTFDTMKKSFDKDGGLAQRMNPGTSFMRKGAVGDWKNHMSPEIQTQFKEWWKKGNSKHNIRFEGVEL